MSEEQKLRKWVGVGYAAKVVGLGTLAFAAGVSADNTAGATLALNRNDKTTALRMRGGSPTRYVCSGSRTQGSRDLQY